jgi:hypothetical protein
MLMGILAKAIYDAERRRSPSWTRFFTFDRLVVVSMLLAGLGLASGFELLTQYISGGFRLDSYSVQASHRAIAGVGLVLIAATYFTFGLIFNAYMEATGPADGKGEAG